MHRTVIRQAAAPVTAALMILGLAACASSSGASGGSGGGSGPILIGEVAGTTGAYGTTGQAMVNGAKMAVAYLNAHGGVMGRKFQLQSYNDNASATLAAQEFDRLVSAGAVAITGSGDTGPAIAAEADRRQVPAIGVVDDGGLTVYPDGPDTAPLPWVFDLGLNTFAWGGKIGSQALAHCKGLAVLHDPTTYGEGGEQGIKSVYDAAGKKLAFDDAITENWASGATVSLTSEINQIKSAGADCVDVWLTPQDQAAFVQAAHNQGANFTIFGNDETDSDATYTDLAKGLADGTISALLTTEVHQNPALKAFQARYQGEFSTPSTPFAEATYDSILMLKQAIESAKSTSPKAVRDAFNHISGFQGLTGTLSFSQGKHTTINADQLTLVKYDAAAQQWVPAG
jgi:ABC-type branched-subunit amino acid transport system substrate-binding protein